MTEPRDEIGDWLDEPVEPLPPPPGTYKMIKARAARRRRNQAMTAAASAVIVIAAIVVVPRLAVTAVQSGRGASIAENTATLPQSSATHTAHNQLRTGPRVQGTGQPLPGGFSPVSATFVGLQTGWVLGTRAGHCLAPSGGGPAGCLALARTDDNGASWYSVPGPAAAGIALGGSGVSQVRFLNGSYGWLFGPELWWTRDGGNTWLQAGTGGQRVISLEAVGNRAFAVFATCGGAPSAQPDGLTGGCSSYRLYSATAGTDNWRRVPGATSGPGSASVVLTQHTGFLVAASGAAATVASGPVSGDGAWEAVAGPCQAAPGGTPASPSASATPSAGTGTQAGTTVHRALLAAAQGSLFALCSTGTAGRVGQPKDVLTSADGGRSWNRRATVPIPGTAWSAAVSPGGGVFVIAASTGLYVSRDQGATWQLALTGPPGGFGYVGMTDVLQGFAIPAGRGQDGMSMTTDGAQTWIPVARSP